MSTFRGFASLALAFTMNVIVSCSTGSAQQSGHEFLYDPETGHLTVKYRGDPRVDAMVTLLIHGPVPLGFPQGAPDWGDIGYRNGSAQLLGPPRSLSFFFAADPTRNSWGNITFDTVLLLYPPRLSTADFGTVEYVTAGEYQKMTKVDQSPRLHRSRSEHVSNC